MGGVKKPTISKAEKSQVAEETEEKPAAKKVKGRPGEKGFKTVNLQRLDDNQAVQTLAPLKAITIYGAARTLGVRASEASQLLRSLEGKGLLRKAAGYSGRYVYAVVSSA